ncbi:MAG TPA: flagellar hook-basal body protein [Clostridiaceae bacterium]|nr:flagellar hook-basal body protein [Clostridiaceae bacterium]
MIQSLHTAASGMKAGQKKLDNIANNISNVNTTGYKQKRVTFTDALYQTILNPVEEDQDNNLQKGHGVLLSAVVKDFTMGSLESTDRDLDFAINGEGFFAVETEEGIKYTRAGNFYTTTIDNVNYLVTANGNFVLDENLERITVADGELSGDLGVFTFVNPEGLSEEGSNLYQVTEASGEAQQVNNAKVSRGFLEHSNVDLTEQLTEMIKAQRAYQVSSRLVSISDEMEGIANNLRR